MDTRIITQEPVRMPATIENRIQPRSQSDPERSFLSSHPGGLCPEDHLAAAASFVLPSEREAGVVESWPDVCVPAPRRYAGSAPVAGAVYIGEHERPGPVDELVADPTGVGRCLLYELGRGAQSPASAADAPPLRCALANLAELKDRRKLVRRLRACAEGEQYVEHQQLKHRIRLQERRLSEARAAARSRKEASTAYLQSGGELNPGPECKAGEPGNKQKRQQARKLKVKRVQPVLAAAPKLESSLCHAVAAAAAVASEQKTEGLKDGTAEAVAEQERVAMEAKLEELVAAAARSVEGTYAELKAYAEDIWFHPLAAKPLWPELYQASRSRDGLNPILWPHKVACAKLREVRLCLEKQIVDGKITTVPTSTLRWTPALAETARAPGTYRELVYDVTIYSLGAGSSMDQDPAGVETESVVFSWEQWCLAHSRRLCSGSFWNVIDRCRTFRAGHHSFPQSDSSPQSATWLCDNVFAALMCVEHEQMAQDSALLMELGYKALSRTLFNALRDMDGPTAAGTYVRCYHVDFRDLWPEQWREAVARAASGEDVKKVVHCMVESVTAAGSHLVETGRDLRDRGWEYCRALPFHIQGCIPAFPDPTSTVNQGIGFMKRLIPVTLACEPEAAAYEHEVCCAMAEEVAEKAPPPDDDNREEAEQHLRDSLRGKGWTPDQEADFMAGALELLEAVELGPAGVEEFFSMLSDRLSHHGVFVKQEAYPFGKIKALRYIVAPEHYIRGVAQALFQEAQERISTVYHEHNVKHRTREQLIEEMAVEMQHGDDYTVFESDFGSFESLISRTRRLANETPVLLAAVCQRKRAAVTAFQHFISETLTLTGPEFKARMEGIRLSGEFLTSIANMVQNTGMSFGSIFRELKVPLGEVRARFRGWTLPWRAEGDDGIFILPKKVMEGLVSMYKKAGARVETEFHALWTDANFCGCRARECRDAKVLKSVDPLEKIAMLTHSLGCEADTDKNDAVLQAAKAMSYLLEYGHVPLLGPYCRRILSEGTSPTGVVGKAAAAAAAVLPSRLSAWVPSSMVDVVEQRAYNVLGRKGHTAFDRHIRGAVMSYHGQSQEKVDEAIRDWARGVRRAISTPHEITDDMRDEVAKMYPELTPVKQIELEERLWSSVSGKACVLPELEAVYQRNESIARMSVRYFTGKREEVESRVGDAFTAAAAKAPKIKDAFTGWITTAVAWFTAMSVALGTIAMVWWFIVSRNPWLLLGSLVGGVSSVLLLTALVWGILWVICGMSFSTARRVTTVGWAVLVGAVATGVVVNRRKIRAAAADISRDADTAWGRLASLASGCRKGVRVARVVLFG